jgi:methylase of polypeptide subunit release factors
MLAWNSSPRRGSRSSKSGCWLDIGGEMELQVALAQAVTVLKDAGVEESRLDAEVLLAHALELTRAQLYARLNQRLSPQDQECYQALIAQRVRHEPVAYIVGHKTFYGLDFLVDRRVLIPRPETELLVERAIEMAQARSPRLIADAGTGCGAIRRLLAQARGHLRPRGAILLEIGADQGPAVAQLVQQRFSMAKIDVIRDYAGLDRVVVVDKVSTTTKS